MKYLAFLWSSLAGLAKILTYGWIVALCRLWRKLCDIFKRWRMRQQLPGRARKASEAPCSPINEPAFTHPDPLIYSQYDLMARGYAVTWDNPDIELRKSGVAVPSSHVDPDTEYEIVARIWNNSTDAVVVGLPVIFSYLSFGVGVKINPIGATSVLRLGVKGGPDHPAFASVKWKTPTTPGHYCLLVFLAPSDDTNFNNNLGQENIVVGKVLSPAGFTFQLRNRSSRDQVVRFEVDSYAIPSLEICDQHGLQNPKLKGRPQLVGAPPVAVPADHQRRNYPVPQGWSVEIDPAQPQLPPEGEITIKVRITPPAGFTGRQPFNVNAFDSQGFAGGVTLYVEAP
jgi:hypothetical protein